MVCIEKHPEIGYRIAKKTLNSLSIAEEHYYHTMKDGYKGYPQMG